MNQLKTKMSREVLILLDSDVVIHLFKADKISLLNELFPGRVRMLDVVLEELLKNRSVRNVVENLFTYKQIEEITFPTTSNQQLFQEFIELKSTITGTGERACLVYCKHYQNIIASSNTTDIIPYCNAHGIAFLTTLDILSIAMERHLISETEINTHIKKITKNNESYLCCDTIAEHRKVHFDRHKLLY